MKFNFISKYRFDDINNKFYNLKRYSYYYWNVIRLSPSLVKWSMNADRHNKQLNFVDMTSC